MARKAPNGSGTIRKKVIEKNGKKYIYFEGRYFVGYDPGTGKPIQKSVTAKTQKEVAAKLKQITLDISNGINIDSQNLTVKSWMNRWKENYILNVAPLTKEKYERDINIHIIPNLGAIKLDKLTPDIIQAFYNKLSITLAPGSVRHVHNMLNMALSKAVDNNLIKSNPAKKVILPKCKKPKLTVLEPEQVVTFVNSAKLDKYKNIFIVALFTGMRSGEIRGLTWDNVNFKKGCINVSRQLVYANSEYSLATPKEDKTRIIYPAKIVMDALKDEMNKQNCNKLYAEELWNNEFNLVFTTESGAPISRQNLNLHFKKVLTRANLPDIRFHDLRHTYAVNAIQAGDDIKTIQENLGHASAAFTLDVYSSAIESMRKKSSERMQQFYDEILAKNSKKNSG